jgi:hypothetical protein
VGDAVIASVIRELAGANLALAQDLLSQMGPSPWRDDAAEAVAVALAPASADRATGLIGLVADPTRAAQIRARVAAAIAAQNPAAAERLLASLPPSDAKTTGSLDAAVALLAAGGQPDDAVRLGSLNLQRDLAIRWIVPELARAQTRSPVSLSGSIQSPYLRSLSLADAAGEMLGRAPVPRPAPDRAAQIRPIVEWEGMAQNRALDSARAEESKVEAALALRSSDHSSLTLRIEKASPGKLYQATYDDGEHRFVWDNLAPDAAGLVALADDKHLRPEYRMRCESRTGASDPVVFDDLLKGAVVGTRRQPFGVPVSTFGGPGYLVPGLADLKRDSFGNFWLYLDHPPYAILKYGPDFSYRFALLLPGPPLAHDLDGDGNLYILHEGNWVSKHGPLGQELGAWELPTGRSPGEFISASGLAIDREAGCIYLADEMLGRVQRFGLDLRLRPLPFTPWGWIGRGDMAYTRAGEYNRDLMSYQLDRPRQLLLDGRGSLLVSCEHYISKFDLGTGKQAPFGRSPVLGWGVTFTDSAFSPSAGLDGHWQRHWLAGVDAAGDVWVADRENEFVVDPRIQVFGPDGTFQRVFDIEDSVRDVAGRPVYITSVKGLVCAAEALYLVDAAGRVYRSSSPTDIVSGGDLYLGPGAAGRQFDLSQLDESKLSLELQPGPVKHTSTGRILAADGRRGPGNCEREGSTSLGDGERSLWAPARIGEPFTVMLLDAAGTPITPTDYTVEFEEKPGLFGSCYDFFRVTNRSGLTWTGVTFVAESVG